MGILNPSKSPEKDQKAARRKSVQTDLTKLGPIKPGGAAGFLNFRDGEDTASKARRKANKGSGSEMDSDIDEAVPSIIGQADAEEDKDGIAHVSLDDARYQGELAEGLRRVKVYKPWIPTYIFVTTLTHLCLVKTTTFCRARVRNRQQPRHRERFQICDSHS